METVKKKKKISALNVFMYIFLSLWCLSMFVCLFWLLMASLKDKTEYLVSQSWLPEKFMWSNYPDAFNMIQSTGKNLFVMLINTLWLTGGNIFLQVLSGTMFAYAIARFRFPGRDVIYWVVIARMMIPIVGTMATTYALYNKLGMYDSPLILISNLHGTGGFLIYYATFKGVSSTYAEAACLDGAGPIRTFFQVMLPQVKGIIVAMAVSSFVANWNEYEFPLLYLPSYPTISSGIFAYQKEFARLLNYPVLFAALTLTIVPCIIAYVVCQEQFLHIDIGGGLKG